MTCNMTYCNQPAQDGNLCPGHADYMERCREWGRRHIAGEATTQDHPGYVPITVNVSNV